jgi:Sec-independent protein translocase protein TatA
MWELVLILVVALVVLGPRQLTDAAKVIGKIYRELIKMTSDIKQSVDFDLNSPPSPPPQAPPNYLSKSSPNDLVNRSGPDFYADLLAQSNEEEKDTSKVDQNKTAESKETKEKSEKTETPK